MESKLWDDDELAFDEEGSSDEEGVFDAEVVEGDKCVGEQVLPYNAVEPCGPPPPIVIRIRSWNATPR